MTNYEQMGRDRAAGAPPLTTEQVRAAARIYANADTARAAA